MCSLLTGPIRPVPDSEFDSFWHLREYFCSRCGVRGSGLWVLGVPDLMAFAVVLPLRNGRML